MDQYQGIRNALVLGDNAPPQLVTQPGNPVNCENPTTRGGNKRYNVHKNSKIFLRMIVKSSTIESQPAAGFFSGEGKQHER